MFKNLIKALLAETSELTKIIEVSLVNSELLAAHGIGPSRQQIILEFVESFCGQVYLVRTDKGYTVVDVDGDEIQLVTPAFAQNPSQPIEFLLEAANDVEENSDDEPQPA